ncbi:MAG: hypothetical protein DBP03_04450 [gamma proteobacterium symbiont of Ctena orbiculata]|nr:MAG: hypothetical protein DBP03_04450 [gamma proteobacterium symbiont of Ctena orbiculata]PUB79047.1 MAG: hypothetical protein DBO99_05135 [gamma proteobacterium symbiont of Ctena orbiculata]
MSEVTNKLKVEKRIPWPGQSEGWWLGLLDSGLRRNDVQLEYPISALPDLTPSVILSANCHKLLLVCLCNNKILSGGMTLVI